MTKVAIVGATGPTGIQLAAELRKTAAAVRVVARGMDKLARLFPDAAVEKRPADILDADATLRAIDGCDLVYDCIGLPGDRMHLHPVTARNIAGALRHTRARCAQVSSYWAYYPQVRAEMNESHPRSGGPPWVRHRREAEDILCEASAAILHLPDFYGPQVQVSTLQNALNEAASGKTGNWLGKADVQGWSRLVGRGLTMIALPVEEMAHSMADLILRRVRNPDAAFGGDPGDSRPVILFASRLTVRGSTGRPAQTPTVAS